MNTNWSSYVYCLFYTQTVLHMYETIWLCPHREDKHPNYLRGVSEKQPVSVLWSVLTAASSKAQNKKGNHLFWATIRNIFPSLVNTICFPILSPVISSVLHKHSFLSAECNTIWKFKLHVIFPSSIIETKCIFVAYRKQKTTGTKR